MRIRAEDVVLHVKWRIYKVKNVHWSQLCLYEKCKTQITKKNGNKGSGVVHFACLSNNVLSIYIYNQVHFFMFMSLTQNEIISTKSCSWIVSIWKVERARDAIFILSHLLERSSDSILNFKAISINVKIPFNLAI
jgi:hypothetical protein